MSDINMPVEHDSFPIQVDVITVVKNSADLIKQTLSSVTSQTYQDINHIIIDGNSTDNTIQIVNDFNHNKNVMVYYQSATGIANAFNDGLSKSQGDLVIFLNSGDTFFDQNVVTRIVESFIQNNWLWGFGETISVSKNRFLKRHINQYDFWKNELFFGGNPMCHQSTIFSRKLLNKVGLYDEKLSLGMDYDFNIRSSLIDNPFLMYFPISYYDTSGVSSRRVFKSYQIEAEIRKKYFPLTITRNLIIDTVGFFKAIQRFLMIPIKLFL